MAHSEMGHKLLERVVTELADVGQIEMSPRMEGRSMIAVLVPRTTKPAKTAGAES